MNTPDIEGLDKDHLQRVWEGYRGRVIAESDDPKEECPYSRGGSFYYMWMRGWNAAEIDLNLS